jgi:hypothetical protein
VYCSRLAFQESFADSLELLARQTSIFSAEIYRAFESVPSGLPGVSHVSFVLNNVLKMAPQACRNKQPVARDTWVVDGNNEQMVAVMCEKVCCTEFIRRLYLTMLWQQTSFNTYDTGVAIINRPTERKSQFLYLSLRFVLIACLTPKTCLIRGQLVCLRSRAAKGGRSNTTANQWNNGGEI